MVGIVGFNGCSNKEVVTDVSYLNYLSNTSNENIAYNLSIVAREIKSSSFKGIVKFKGKQYYFDGEIIVKDSIENSLIHINYKNNDLYLKNGNIYLSYYYNGTNVIVKDTIADSIIHINYSIVNCVLYFILYNDVIGGDHYGDIKSRY